MSDDAYSRAYRDNDRYGRGGSAFGSSAPAHHDDPLSELARLIGQGDALEQQAGRQAALLSDASNHNGYHYPGTQPVDPRYDPQPSYRQEPYGQEPYGQEQYGQEQYGQEPYGQEPYGQAYDDPRYQGPPYQQQHNGFQGGYPQQQPGYQMAPYYANESHDGHDHHNDHDDHHDDYVDTPSSGRGGFLTIVAIFCLAVIGTAGAFAYRTFFTPSAPSPPPVVMADTSPNKIVPASTKDDSSKSSADWPGAGQSERVVPREEQPMNLQNLTSGPPRVVTAPPPPATAAPQVGVPSQMGMVPSGEPKKIRTLTFPQPGDPFGPPVNSMPAPTPTALSSPAPSQPPTSSAPPPRWTAPAPRAQAAPPPQPAPPPGEAPLSLSPQAVTAETPAQHAMRVASVPNKPAAAAGSYVVQLSSQRSEDDAQSTFRVLQTKFPSLLEGRQPIIRKADLPQGTFYRVQVGPLAHDEAVQLCEDLKSAHGDCLIQRN